MTDSRFVLLDYLRGIAALMVLIVHWGTTGVNPPVEAARLYMTVSPPETHSNFLGVMMAFWSDLVRSTWLLDIRLAPGGVMLFFLVSGYVIPISVEKYSASGFAIRRVFRLLPTVWAALAIWLALNLVLQAFGFADGNSITLRALVANMFLVHDWLWIPHVDMAFWTLLIEVKFYVVMAAMVIVARKVSIPAILATALFLMTLTLPFFSSDGSAYNSLFSLMEASGHWWLFYGYRVLNEASPYIIFMLTGTVIYLWRGDRISGSAALVYAAMLFAMFATAFLVGPVGAGQIYYVEDGLRALIIFWGVLAIDRTGWFAGKAPWLTKPLRFLGAISYPLYLTHGLIGMSIILAVYTASENMTFALLVGAVVVFPLSWIIHRYVEQVGQKAGGHVSRSVLSIFARMKSQGADT